MTIDQTIERIRADLAWRGPSGRPLGHIVIPRADAEILVDYLSSPHFYGGELSVGTQEPKP